MQPTDAAVFSERAAESRSDPTLILHCERDEGTWIVEAGPASEPALLTLSAGQTVALGAGSDVEMRVFDPAVSRRHCGLSIHEGRVLVRDLGSKNGLYVAGARVECASLGPGATFTIGRTVVACRPAPSRLSDPGPAPRIPGLVATSSVMREVIHELVPLASVKGAVLFVGETGSGKDVLARALHWLGPRRDRPFVPLNVGTLPRDLADAELFGHDRGAFTGALGARDGAFVEAHTGTLFLDEIAELPLDLQVKLLRVLEDGEVRPLGSKARKKVDARVVSATWAPLERAVTEGAFRQDLYQRLSVFVVQVPALRERRADLPALSRHFLDQLESEIGPRALSPGAISRLAAHGWPGNVRELRNVLYRAALRSKGRVITTEEVIESLQRSSRSRVQLSGGQARAVVELNGGNVSAAARQAGVARSTFRDWMRQADSHNTPRSHSGTYSLGPKEGQARLSERALDYEPATARPDPRARASSKK